jgi:hypothetical protein
MFVPLTLQCLLNCIGGFTGEGFDFPGNIRQTQHIKIWNNFQTQKVLKYWPGVVVYPQCHTYLSFWEII